MAAKQAQADFDTAEELRKMEYEPLSSAEKKLISYSLIIGVVLLIILVWVSYTFFPATG